MLLMITMLLLDNPDRMPEVHSQRTVLFFVITEAEAVRRHGQWGLFRIRLDSLPGEHDGCTLYDCINRAEHDRTVWFVGQPEIDESETITVRAKLGVIRHKPSVINGAAFEGFTEFRLMQAVPVP